MRIYERMEEEPLRKFQAKAEANKTEEGHASEAQVSRQEIAHWFVRRRGGQFLAATTAIRFALWCRLGAQVNAQGRLASDADRQECSQLSDQSGRGSGLSKDQ